MLSALNCSTLKTFYPSSDLNNYLDNPVSGQVILLSEQIILRYSSNWELQTENCKLLPLRGEEKEK
jgi:hypothetical protein